MKPFLLVLPLLCGCGAGGLAAVRGQAVDDMRCTEQDLKVEPAHTATGAPTDSGIYYAEGCQQVRRYAVGCNIFGYCPDPQSVDALGLVKKQAAFDLKCDAAQVGIERLNVDTFGARGCDRQASYVLVCRGRDCKVVQNTQAQ